MYQRFTCVGRATADAKRQKAKKSDVEYTTFAVAVNEGKDKVTFFDVAVFGEKGKPVAKYLSKGRLVLVDDRIEKNQKGYANVVANQVIFLDSLAKKDSKSK